MARGAGSGVAMDVAAQGLATGILANTALKVVAALAVGRGRFRWIVSAALVAIGAALAIPLVW
jgi:hypothetical protein